MTITRSFPRVAALTLALGSLAVAAPPAALAWGSAGHHLIAHAAMLALPTDLPAFVRSPAAVDDVTAFSSEADRSKGAGHEHDADRDPGHFLDLGDDGKVAGVVDVTALPTSRDAYDTALRAGGTTQYRMGFVPYQIVDGWQQVAKDFAIWRVDRVGEEKAASAEDRAWFATDRARRQDLTIRDIGYWSHFVGDASQPLHISVHYNGWGDYPNPRNFTQSHATHAHFEGAYVRENATLALVQKAMKPLDLCACTIEQQTGAYLKATNAEVVPFYTLEQQGAFAQATSTGVDFVVARLADGADELRDMIAEAYAASGKLEIGYPGHHTVDEYESGAALPDRHLVGGSD